MKWKTDKAAPTTSPTSQAGEPTPSPASAGEPTSRRTFLKRMGLGMAAFSALWAACKRASKQGGADPTAASGGDERPSGMMTTRTQRRTGDKVSLLGYGCMRWPQHSTADGRDEEIDQAAVNALVDYAMAHGVNYYDTSPAYLRGHSETATGKALSRYPRSRYFVATKLSNFAPSTWSRSASMAIYRQSFKALQVDYIDYYLLHAVGMGDGMTEFRHRYIENGMLDFLLDERKAGRIRHLGFSYHGDVAVFDYLLSKHDEYQWDFVQIQMNYVDWKHAKEENPRNTNAEYLYGELQKRGIQAVIMEPLLGGRLSKVHDHIAAQLKQRRPNDSVASWAFRFAGSYDGVLTVLSGMTYMEHLYDNVATYSPLLPLSSDDYEFLEQTALQLLRYQTVPCNECQYCMPCPYGINIPGIFAHYNKCVNEGNTIADLSNEHYKQARRVFLIGYDRSVPKLRQADHCIACGKCKTHCPQNIDIPQSLQKIHQFVETLKQGKAL